MNTDSDSPALAEASNLRLPECDTRRHVNPDPDPHLIRPLERGVKMTASTGLLT